MALVAPLLLISALGLGPGSLVRAADDGESDGRTRDELYSPHRRPDGTFFTPWATLRTSIFKFLRWQFESNAYDRSGALHVPVVENDGAYLRKEGEPTSLTWIGHATYAIHDGGDVVLTDPIWGERALIPKRVTPPGVPLEAIPADAFAVISHNHYDHLDAETVETLPATVGWYVPLGLGQWVRDRGPEDVTELDWWQSATRGRWTITCLPSQHWSRRLGQAQNSTLWCAWLLESDRHRYFFAGDTGYFQGFAEFGRRYGPIDAALLPIGAYAPRWFMSYQHMDPQQAYQAFLDLGARKFFALHWGTFDLTDEPPDYPPTELRSAIDARGGSHEAIHIPAIGERVMLEGRAPRAPGFEPAGGTDP